MKNYTSKEIKRFNHLIGEIDAVYHDMSLKLGLSDSAMHILYTICNNGESCPLQEICCLSGISKQTINSAIRKLEADEIVYLAQIDRKNKNVCLTEKGKTLAENTVLKIIKIENEIFASWSDDDVKKYLNLTEMYLCAVKDKAQKINEQ